MDAHAPIRVDHAEITRAVERLREGHLVAFPTETVYGLGADALNATAVARVFALKGRPAFNPLIVHVASIDMARSLTTAWSPQADALARAFWPGPLTIVVPKAPHVPGEVTAAGDTVALRQPAHAVAQALLEAFAGPLVGPSANRSGHVSPTTAAHVRAEFADQIQILDGGPCTVGVESTVVMLDGDIPRILRPGAIGDKAIAQALSIDPESVAHGPAQVHSQIQSQVQSHPTGKSYVLQSPGLLASHYAPRTPVILVDNTAAADPGVLHLVLPPDALACARDLYALLRDADARAQSTSLPRIVITIPREATAPDHDALWDAILDRLRRAAAPRE